MRDHRYTIIFSTVASEKEGTEIASALISKKIAACVSVIPNIVSHFNWLGKFCKETEYLLIIKTTMKKMNAVFECVKKMHSYDVPEIIALPVIAGYDEYLKWIEKETK